MRTAEIMVCIALCGLASCHNDPPASSADESTEGAEYAQDPVQDEQLDPLHPVEEHQYPAGEPDLANPGLSGPELGIEEMGGSGGFGGTGGRGGEGGIGGLGGMLR